jgi:hypothetical protein
MDLILMDIELANIRRELEQALDTLKFEIEGGHLSPRVVSKALDHVQTALLLLSGVSSNRIGGHPKGSSHGENEASTTNA